MPARLPVAHVRSPWLRYSAVVPLLVIGTLCTWAIAPILWRAPFTFFYAAATAAAVFGGIGPGALAIAAAVAVVVGVLPSFGEPPLDLANHAAFVAVAAMIVFLADRGAQSSRRERAQRQWSDVALQSIGDAVIVTDARGQVLTVNGVAEELTGWTAAEARLQPVAKVFEIVNEYTRTAVENPIDRVCREGKVAGLADHTVLLRRDGREIPIDDSGAPIWSEDGHVVGAVLVFRDISQRRETERQRTALLESERVLRAEAQAANRSKDQFLAVLSHELRTPLNAILGWSHVGRTGERPSDALRALEVIERNARRQARLVEDVLDVSRIVSGKLNLEFVPVDLGSVVEAAADAVRPLVQTKELAFEVRGDCGGSVLGDAHRLHQVVSNLLSNAVKFTPRGGRVEVGMEREGATCVVTVRDTGIGIAPDFLPTVFDQFRQEDTGSARRFGGLGLGLTIVHHLVTMHGGTVSAQSEGPGRGATFTFRLPLAGERAAAPASRERAGFSEPRLAGLRVLAVDDEPDSREFVGEVLRRAGAEVRLAGSAAEALERLGERVPDVLILDIEMPGEDGYTLLRRVREAGHALPAIALTAHSSAEDRMRALEAGFVHHVPKPVEPAELQLVVANIAPASGGSGSESR